MEKPGAGGRPKAVDIWEHVMVLEGKKVRCKHCGFEFAASANRIKSHIHQIKGQGIRLCTAFPQLCDTASRKVTNNLKGKEDLIDSQDLSTLDRARDYNKPSETMIECHMSPKTMWEGIKALQQTQIHQERFQVGPFSVSHMVNERDLQLIQYVFEQSCDETIFSSPPRLYLNQYEFTTLRPQTCLDSLVIDVFVDILTDTERKKSKLLNWYLPVMFSHVAFNSGDLSLFLDFVARHKWKRTTCLTPYILRRIKLLKYGILFAIILWMKLLAMEKLFGDVAFAKFHQRMASNISLQPNDNGYDCGIFVIKYMQQSDNYVSQNPSFQFDSNKERLDLALELLKSDLNQEREILYHKSSRKPFTSSR
ncbi:uncharacterized protein LOC129317432 [Prosopis cineraria]|uniref:uncharacterized protein LOC129317432 n=1 Tax=Prosopis cineraria TaxID=364024 RepID=UPI00240F536D|nr:uncharacterized protein LOC129317432 [Prosopis cineraria]